MLDTSPVIAKFQQLTLKMYHQIYQQNELIAGGGYRLLPALTTGKIFSIRGCENRWSQSGSGNDAPDFGCAPTIRHAWVEAASTPARKPAPVLEVENHNQEEKYNPAEEVVSGLPK